MNSCSDNTWHRPMLRIASSPTATAEKRPKTWLMLPIINSVTSLAVVEGGRSGLQLTRPKPSSYHVHVKTPARLFKGQLRFGRHTFDIQDSINILGVNDIEYSPFTCLGSAQPSLCWTRCRGGLSVSLKKPVASCNDANLTHGSRSYPITSGSDHCKICSLMLPTDNWTSYSTVGGTMHCTSSKCSTHPTFLLFRSLGEVSVLQER